MEVHKHPHHVTHKKKWGEYLYIIVAIKINAESSCHPELVEGLLIKDKMLKL